MRLEHTTTEQLELVRWRAQKVVNDIERLQEASKRRNIEPSQKLVDQMILALHRIDGVPEEPEPDMNPDFLMEGGPEPEADMNPDEV